MELIVIFLAGFASVFAMGFQSRNVNTGKFKSAAMTSFLIAVSQVIVFVQVIERDDIVSKLVYGLSGSVGIVCAMKFHKIYEDYLDGKGK